MVATNKTWIDYILRFKSNMDSGMFLPMQMAAVKALQLGDDWYQQLNLIYYERKRCLLYTSDAADERSSVDLGGRRNIKKKIKIEKESTRRERIRKNRTTITKAKNIKKKI